MQIRPYLPTSFVTFNADISTTLLPLFPSLSAGTAIRATSRMQSNGLSQYDSASFSIWIIRHTALVIPDHRPVKFRIGGPPLQARYAGVSGCCK